MEMQRRADGPGEGVEGQRAGTLTRLEGGKIEVLRSTPGFSRELLPSPVFLLALEVKPFAPLPVQLSALPSIPWKMK